MLTFTSAVAFPSRLTASSTLSRLNLSSSRGTNPTHLYVLNFLAGILASNYVSHINVSMPFPLLITPKTPQGKGTGEYKKHSPSP